MFAATHQQVRNAMQDMNNKYKELGVLEKNVAALYNMIQDLSLIVKNQTSIINSIEANLHSTKNYVEKAEKNLISAKEEYTSGNEVKKKFI